MKNKSNETKNIRLNELKNIGKTIEKRLNEIEIYTKEDLENTGPVEAFKKIKENNPGKTIPVCYYLYSFEGALTDKQWNDIPQKTKEYLLKKIGKYNAGTI